MHSMGTILTINAQLTTILSVLPNLLVIFFGCTTKVLEIRQYGWIIAAQSTLEILFCGVLSLLDLELEGKKWCMLIYVRGLAARTSTMLCIVLFFGACGLTVITILLLPLVFLYRYESICSNETIKKLFTTRGLITIAVSFSLFALVIVVGFWSQSSLADDMANAGFSVNITKEAIIIALSYAETRTIRDILFDSTYSLLLIIAIIASYLIVIFCAIKIFRWLNTKQPVENKKEIQQKLNIVMLTQNVLVKTKMGSFFASSGACSKRQNVEGYGSNALGPLPVPTLHQLRNRLLNLVL
ncbi:hypothetical protein Tcan_04473 [Toxocara canis]|uniref:G_PROTEIN_RECEP_F1_2 domain-containing protein n=1 Tax=Toxocara canis TaxID=6265 RepID=A0A0B2VCT9_TOXCA|nr:hypothetical protein Tcan_04473 [Toxocara canis]